MANLMQNIAATVVVVSILSIVDRYSPEAANMLACFGLGFSLAALLSGKGAR